MAKDRGPSGCGVAVASLSVVAAVVALWLWLGYLPAERARRADFAGEESPLQRFGTYGDGFGVVSSLASSLALAGVALALILQWREHRDARVEADDARRRELARASQDAEMMTLASMIIGRCVMEMVRCDNFRFNMQVWRDQKTPESEQAVGREKYNQEHAEEVAEIGRLMDLAYAGYVAARAKEAEKAEPPK